MSEATKNEELIARGIWATHPHRGESWEHELDIIKVECWEQAAEALAATTPVQGEPNDDRETLLKLLVEHRPSRWRSFDNDQVVLRCCGQDFGRLAGKPRKSDRPAIDLWEVHLANALMARAVVPDAATAHSPIHFECNCVPNLGPTHCHACTDEAGHPIIWSACSAAPAQPSSTVDEEKLELIDALAAEAHELYQDNSDDAYGAWSWLTGKAQELRGESRGE